LPDSDEYVERYWIEVWDEYRTITDCRLQ
jgi:hypothetical protein